MMHTFLSLPCPSLSAVGCLQVVGWGHHFEDLASGLAEFAVEGTQVNVINPERPRGLPEVPLRGCQFHHIEGSATSFQSFRQADLADCDSILLGQTMLLAFWPCLTNLPHPASFDSAATGQPIVAP